MSSTAKAFLILLAVLVSLVSSSGMAQETGRIAGTVVASEDGRPLAYANVMVRNTPYGTFVKPGGRFTIDHLPVGTYTVVIKMMGYKDGIRENVVVRPNQTTELRFRLEETVVITLPPITVIPDEDVVDVDRTETRRPIKPDELEVRSIDTLEEALADQPGVLLDQGEIYIRGGRPGETKANVDGMPISDAFVANTDLIISLASLENIEVLTGGFDAEYGNIQSGVINLQTKEGGLDYSGLIKFMTDDYGAPDKTYFNYDNVAVGFGGPVLVKELRFYASGEATFSDTYLKTPEPRQEKELLGFIRFRDRQTNNYSSQTKVTYVFSPTRRLSAEVLASGEKSDFYHHAYSRIGYWSEIRNHWWFEPLDATYSLYVAPAHTPDITNQHRSVKMAWRDKVGMTSFYNLRAGRFTATHREVVLGKPPWEYVTPSENEMLDPENHYFAVQGDFPHWQRYHSTMWTGKGDIVIPRSTGHEIKLGAEANLFRVEMTDILYPSEEQPRGVFSDIYNFHCWGFSAFLQDKIAFEGMNLRVGMRFDIFDPGRHAVDAYNEFILSTGFDAFPVSFRDRAEWQISPRLGVSYPISGRDALYFNYGRFYQIPRLEVLFQSLGHRGTALMEFGNPLMDAATTVMYEVGIQHQFTRTIMGDIAMFYKDIFGLTGTEAGTLTEDCEFIQRYGPTAVPVVYTNLDYGSVRGIEIKLSKRFSGHFSGSFTYTFSEATGSSSSELQGSNVVSGGLDRAPITELPLNWDRNHVFSANLHIASQGLWNCNIDWSYSSGAPYTPRLPREREDRAALINSERLPARSVLNVKADKVYRIAGQEVSFFLEGRNILDKQNIATLSPGAGPGGNGNYVQYYSSEGELGGAYDRGELLGLPDVMYVPLNDPRVYSAPRNFRVGISFDW